MQCNTFLYDGIMCRYGAVEYYYDSVIFALTLVVMRFIFSGINIMAPL